MASVNISEEEFMAVAGAAYDALMKNDLKTADTLDKLARKMNASLSNSNLRPFGQKCKPITWQDVPSVLDQFKEG
jgi:hypothetical protein